jgi:hypothetical protein
MTGVIDADLLTRTTLAFDERMAAATLGQMVRALQRVPGVLLAELTASDAHLVVAHDAGVPANALVAAAENAGVDVRIVSDTRGPIARAQPQPARNRNLAIAGALAFVALALVDALVKNQGQKHTILIVLTVSLWAGFFVTSFLRRR